MNIREDKFKVGDKVGFIEEDPYIGIGICERHAKRHGKGPYTIKAVEDVPLQAQNLVRHTQYVTIDDIEYSGYWLKLLS